MRPRVFPAEDKVGRAMTTERSASFNEAAGIPRGRRRARTPRRSRECKRFNEAAGIPRGRHFSPVSLDRAPVGFNEAAGIPRGRRRGGRRHDQGGHRASMRPRVFPAEDVEKMSDALGRIELQ